MFDKLAHGVTRHAWWVIGAWVVAAVVVVLFSPSLADYTTSNQSQFLPSHYESQKAQAVAQKDFPVQAGATGSLVVNRSDKKALTSTDQQKASGLAGALTADKIPGVTSVSATQSSLSSDKKAFLIQVAFKGQPGDSLVNTAVGTVRDKATSYLAGSGLTSGLTGNAAINVDTGHAYASGESIIGIATVLLIIVLLGLIFRSPLIAILPIIIIAVVHAMTVALSADLSKAFGFEVGPTLGPLLIVVLFGIGTDYIIFLLYRYREQLRAGDDTAAGLLFSVHKVGVVISSAALTVVAAFAALLLASLGSLQTLAPGLVVAVVLMLIAALTLVPAVFSLLGSHLFWPYGIREAKPSRRLAWIGRGVSRHPLRLGAICIIVLAGLSLGLINYKPTYNTLQELPSGTLSLKAFNSLEASFPAGALGPTQVFVTGKQTLTSDLLNPMVSKLSKTKGVAAVLTPTLSNDKKSALVTVLLKNDPYSTTALDNVKGPVRSAAHGSVPGDQVLVGGTSSQLVDVRAALNRDLTVVIPVAFVIIAVILGLLLQAIVAPLLLLVGVALSFAATLGLSVLVFINAASLTGIDFSIPIVLYLFVVAIGTDYNILTSHRLREETLGGKAPHEGAELAVLHGAPAVSAAALILAGSFASLMLTGIATLTELGFGVAIGIILSAFLMATRLVPSMASLLGHWFWWPTKPHLAGGGSGGAPPPDRVAVPAREPESSHGDRPDAAPAVTRPPN